jgi:hypothetical protein
LNVWFSFSHYFIKNINVIKRLILKTEIIADPIRPANIKTAFIIILLLAFTCYGVYWLRPKTLPEDMPLRPSTVVPGKCMYWAGDKYLPGPCNQLHRDTPVVPLDTFKLVYFKKINDWSTLSKNSIKKVWYGKVNGKLEIFTSAGFHPVDTTKRLLPLTNYMLKKYVHPH